MKIHFLGTGSATPNKQGNTPSSQVIDCGGKDLYMIDCGECAQYKAKKMGINLGNLSGIFISHLHGDHMLGLINLISTMSITINRTKTLPIYSPPGLKDLIQTQLDYFCDDLTFKLEFIELNSRESITFELSQNLLLTTVPLNHTVDCIGYIIKEKPKRRKINPILIDKYNIPQSKIRGIICEGDDFITENGTVVKNKALLLPPRKSHSYAYCSDTAQLSENSKKLLRGVEILYHETSFMESESKNAIKYKHSTTKDAGILATEIKPRKLLIGHISSRYPEHKAILIETRKYYKKTYLAKELTSIEL
jgi:ribonuclease Z